MAGPFLGSLLGFGAQSASNYLSYMFDEMAQKRQYEYQRALNQQGYDLTQQAYRETPSNYRAGLEAAGFNPLLAVSTSNIPSFSGGSSSAVRTAPTDMSNLATNAYKTFKLERDRTNAEVQNLMSGAEANNAKADLDIQNAISERIKQSGYQLDNVQKELQNQLSKKDLSYYDYRFAKEMENMISQTKLNLANSNAAYINAYANDLSSRASMVNASTNRSIFEVTRDKEAIEKQWRKRHPYQASWQAGVGQWTGALGNIFAGSGSKLIRK